MTFTSSKFDKPTDRLVFGVNTTRLNREFIITFRPKNADGTLGKKRFLTGRQLCELLGDTTTLANIIRRLENAHDVRMTAKLRATGEIKFCAR